MLTLQLFVDEPLGEWVVVPGWCAYWTSRSAVLVGGWSRPLEALGQLEQPIAGRTPGVLLPLPVKALEGDHERFPVGWDFSGELVGDVNQRRVHEPVAEALAAEGPRVVDPDPGVSDEVAVVALDLDVVGGKGSVALARALGARTRRWRVRPSPGAAPRRAAGRPRG